MRVEFLIWLIYKWAESEEEEDMCIAFCLFDKMSNKGNGTSYFLLRVFVWKFIQNCLPTLFYSQLEIDYEMPSKQKVV